MAEVGGGHKQPWNIDRARSARSRAAGLHTRAQHAQQRAVTLVQQSAALLLAAEQARLHVTRKELLGRSECARSWARMETRPVIEQAKSILMAQYGCGPEAAFDLLRRASQRSNVPVRELAARIVVIAAGDARARPQPSRRARYLRCPRLPGDSGLTGTPYSVAPQYGWLRSRTAGSAIRSPVPSPHQEPGTGARPCPRGPGSLMAGP